MTRTLRAPAPRHDEGAALLTVIMLIALLVTLTLTLAVITTTNLESARQTQQAGAAVNASDAGVAQALTYLRTNGVAVINACSPTCATDPYGNKANPATIHINGKAAQQYKVWIEPRAPYPANKPGLYRIHAEGIAGGPAGRHVTVDVSLSSYKVPLGILANTVSGGGDAGVHFQSIFSTGCVYQRSKIEFEGIDTAYGIPAAVHSSQIITDSNGSGEFCPSTGKPIHKTTGAVPARFCSTAYPYDTDRNGGPLTGTTCHNRARAEFGNLPQFDDPSHLAHNYPKTSLLADNEALFDRFGLNRPPFTQAQLDQLRTIAISQGNYHTRATGWASPTQDNAVMFFDLAQDDPGGLVDLNDLVGWSRDQTLTATDARCQPRSLVIIIEGGNARLNSNQTLFASVFLTSGDPYGKVSKANGTSRFTGTLYANNIDLTGTSDMFMDKCFMNNPSPALFNVETFNYREVDR